MRRVPYPLWLLPGAVLLPVVSGPLLDTPTWLKVGLVAAGVLLPALLLVVRYESDPEPSDAEIVRRRLAASGLTLLAVFSVVWMVGGVDHDTSVPLDVMAVSDADTLRYDVSVDLPNGALLRDVTPVGGRVKAFFPNPDNPTHYLLSLWEPPTSNDIELVVSWNLAIWRTVGEVTVSIEAVPEDA